MKFTQDQEKAIKTIGRNVIVSAGAGSGKTAVLKEKVYYLMKEKNYSLDDMLILTFTNLASAEMKQRIRSRIENEFPKEASLIDTANICTFDSYALNLVKKYHLLLGLDAKIDLIQENVINIKCREWIDELFNSLYEKEDQEFLDLVNYLCFKDDENLKIFISDLVKKQNEREKDYFKDIDVKEYTQLIDKVIEEKVHKLNEINGRLYDAFLSVNNGKWQEEVNKSHDVLFSCHTLEDYENIKNNIPRLSSITLDEEDKNNKELFKEIKEELKEELGSVKKRSELKEEFLNNLKYIKKIQELASSIYKKQEDYKYKLQCFEYGDIAYFAYKLVEENEDIKESISNSFKIIMVDEYQDTSYAQERFLLKIAHDNLFMVGDIKQSIYRFRDAKPEIFKEKYEKYKKEDGGIKIDLNDNFRSRKEVLNDINKIFSNIMTLDIGDADYKNEHIIIPGNKAYDTLDITPPTSISLSYDPNDEYLESLNLKNKSEIEANIIACDILNRIKNKQEIMEIDKDGVKKKEVDFSSFCILTQTTTNFKTFQYVFKDKGIPLIAIRVEDSFDNDLSYILKNCFILLNQIENNEELSKHAFASLARSFLYEYKDSYLDSMFKDDSWRKSQPIKDLKEILDSRKNSSLGHLIDLLFTKTNIYTKLISVGEIDYNIHALMSFKNVIEDMDSFGYNLKDLIVFFDHLDDYGEKYKDKGYAPSGNAVKLMNIHQSKGLEFPIIYYAELFKKFNEEEKKKSMLISKDYGIILPSPHYEKNIFHESYFAKEDKENLSERIRLFYVSLTRAKEQMIFLMPKEEKEKDVDIESSKSFYDFIKASKVSFKNEKGIINDLKNQSETLERKDLTYEQINIPLEERKVTKVSKKLSLDVDKSALSFGEELHFIMQIVDFKKKDVSFIKEKYLQNVVSKFLSSPLCEELLKGKIYKEYEFVDDEHHGIIDLFSIREKDIILVDYKLKNIDDSAYEEQIKTYASFLKKTFNLKVKAYLYALLTSEVKEINLEEKK